MAFVLPLIGCSAIGVPIFCILLLSTFLCAPPFIGSMLSDCKAGLEIPFQLRISILVLESLMYAQSVIAASFYAAQIMFCGIICLWDYLRIISTW
jgi:hypothetical protein